MENLLLPKISKWLPSLDHCCALQSSIPPALCAPNQLLIFDVAIKVILTRCSYISKDGCMYFLSLNNAMKYITSARSRVAEADGALGGMLPTREEPAHCSHTRGRQWRWSVYLSIHGPVHKQRSSLGSLFLNSQMSDICLRKTIYFYSFPAVSYKRLSLPEERLQKEPISAAFLWTSINWSL